MNIDARKMNLVRWLIQLQNETYLNDVEQIYYEYQKSKYESDLHPMSLDELYNLIEKAEKDIFQNRIIYHEDIVSHFTKK